MLTAVRYEVRPMALGDIPQVVDIERESFPAMWPQTTYKRELRNHLARYLVVVERQQAPEDVASSEPTTQPSPGWRGAFRRLLRIESPPESTQELILGFVGLWLMMGEAHIVTLAVRGSRRRCGLGELLLIRAIDAAVANGQHVITLEVRRTNEAAISLYEKYGFSRAGVRRRYYENDEDAVIMTTQPLGSPAFQERYALLKEAHARHWGGAYDQPDGA
jgi:ribosomal-protein-alanine N-acetyltransferase